MMFVPGFKVDFLFGRIVHFISWSSRPDLTILKSWANQQYRFLFSRWTYYFSR
jgi:hypothetical protein